MRWTYYQSNHLLYLRFFYYFMGISILFLMLSGCGGTALKSTISSDPSRSSSQAEHIPKEALQETSIPVELQDEIRQSEMLGHMLYAYDMPAAIGSDVLAQTLGDLSQANLSGYLVFREGDDQGRPQNSWLVIFYKDYPELKAAYKIRVTRGNPPGTHLEQIDPPKAAGEWELALFRARQSAIQAVPQSPQPLNPVVLPAEVIGETGVLVYLLASTTKSGIIVLGKHYRVLISADGKEVKRFEPLSKSAMEMPPSSQGGQPVAVYVTHLLGEWPLETHVFINLLHRLDVFVMTGKYLWQIHEGKIALRKAQIEQFTR
jgi:hypothetical protein